MTDKIKTKEVNIPSFIRKRHELDKLFKALQELSPKAIELLEGILEDVELPIKIRFEAAQTLLNKQIDTAKQINADEMQRLIAEYKFNRDGGRLKGIGNGSTVDDDDDTPLLDFDNVRQI